VKEEVSVVEEVNEAAPDATEVKEVVSSEEAPEEQSAASDPLNQLDLKVCTSTVLWIASVNNLIFVVMNFVKCLNPSAIINNRSKKIILCEVALEFISKFY
jgi:hypothetical protein